VVTLSDQSAFENPLTENVANVRGLYEQAIALDPYNESLVTELEDYNHSINEREMRDARMAAKRKDQQKVYIVGTSAADQYKRHSANLKTAALVSMMSRSVSKSSGGVSLRSPTHKASPGKMRAVQYEHAQRSHRTAPSDVTFGTTTAAGNTLGHILGSSMTKNVVSTGKSRLDQERRFDTRY
jgi:hypothetical protein